MGSSIIDIPSGGGGAGDLILLETQEVTSPVASVDFTSNIDGTYSTYKIIVSELKSVSDDVALALRFSNDGGSTFETSSYANAIHYTNGTANAVYSSSTAYVVFGTSTGGIGLGNEPTSHGHYQIYLSGNADSSLYTLVNYQMAALNGAAGASMRSFRGTGTRQVAEVSDAIRFIMSSGNIASGTFKLYGLK